MANQPLNISEVLHLSFIEKSKQLEKEILTQIVRVVSKLPNQKFVTPENYYRSGASEYEILFNYTLQYKSEECEINYLLWRNTRRIDDNYNGVYEACHHYMRS